MKYWNFLFVKGLSKLYFERMTIFIIGAALFLNTSTIYSMKYGHIYFNVYSETFIWKANITAFLWLPRFINHVEPSFPRFYSMKYCGLYFEIPYCQFWSKEKREPHNSCNLNNYNNYLFLFALSEISVWNLSLYLYCH